ncbi:MAG: branched-chain amino acid ABC transporter permease [Candidatus Hodarchaeota archaeon]
MALLNVNLLSHMSLALVYAATLIMLTIGLNMVYSVLKFSNFAHAEYVTMGMFISWWGLQIMTYTLPADEAHFINNLLIQAMFAFLIVGLFGILGEILVYNRLRFIRASPRSFTVASIGIGLIARNFLAMIFGNFPVPNTSLCSDCTSNTYLPGWLPYFLRRDIYSFVIIENSETFGTQEINITGFELYIIIMAIIMVISIDFFFRYTKFGIAMRATADSEELAQVSGINTRRIIFYTWFLAAGLTGFGAAFVRANQPRFSSLDGFYMLLPIFAVVILGGVGSYRGGIVAAFILAYIRQATVILFTEFQWTGGGYITDLFKFGLEGMLEDWLGFTITFAPAYADGIGFVVLIIVLLVRPQGIFGSVEATRARV